MKHRISHLSPHQNAKIIALHMAIMSLIITVPIALITAIFGRAQGASFWLTIGMPLAYLVFGYVMSVVGCWLYNRLANLVGGIEFESQDAPPDF